MSKQYYQKPSYQKFTFKTDAGTPAVGRIVITNDFKKKVDLLHKRIGNTEWCGFLFYKYISGAMNQPDTLVFEAVDIFLMDIGSETFTEGNTEKYAPQLLKFKLDNPHLEDECQMGMIHTHHTMNTFFSGTDLAELNDSVGAYSPPGYYLSLIVNMSNDWKAKVVYLIQEEVSSTVTGKISNFNGDEEGCIVRVNTNTTREPRTFMADIDLNVEVPNIPKIDYLTIDATVGSTININDQELKIMSNQHGILTLVRIDDEIVDTSIAELDGRITYMKEENARKPVKTYGAYRNYSDQGSSYQPYNHQSNYRSNGGTGMFPVKQEPDEEREKTSGTFTTKGVGVTNSVAMSIAAKSIARNPNFNGTLEKALEELIDEIDNASFGIYSSDRYTDMRNKVVNKLWDDIEYEIGNQLVENFNLTLLEDQSSRTRIINGIKSFLTSFTNLNIHRLAWTNIITEFKSNDNLGCYLNDVNMMTAIEMWKLEKLSEPVD